MNNIYYDTESCGLKQVGCLDKVPDYDFDTLLVVEAIQSGKMYWAHSSGCSCPCPFEEYSYVSDVEHNLQEINRETFDTFLTVVKNFHYATVDERQSLIRKVQYRLDKVGK